MSIAFEKKRKKIPMRARKIAVLRDLLHLSADRFGVNIGYSGEHILSIERGLYNASDEFCEKAALTYGVDKIWLLEDDIPVDPIFYEHSNVSTAAVRSSSAAFALDDGATPGDRLRSVLKDSGLSQREFCSRIGASTSTLCSFMDGRKQITKRYAEKVEKAFGIGTDWLLYGREECKENPCGDEMIAFLKSSPKVRAIVAKEMEKAARKDGESSPEAGKIVSDLMR